MIKVQINQQGPVSTYWVTDYDIRINGPQKYMEIYLQEWAEQPGMEPTRDKEKLRPMRVDNTTLLPCILPDGTPVMTEITRQATDADGSPRFVVIETEGGESYTDYSQPLMETVQVQKTIGEYDAALWHLAYVANPQKVPAELIITEGIRRRANQLLGLSLPTQPFVFVVTPAFTATYGNDY